MPDAGAAAIELNFYYLPGDPTTSGRDVAQRAASTYSSASKTRVKDAVTVPVAVKLSPHFSSTGEIALRVDEAGVDALVVFNQSLASTRRRSPWCTPSRFRALSTVCCRVRVSSCCAAGCALRSRPRRGVEDAADRNR